MLRCAAGRKTAGVDPAEDAWQLAHQAVGGPAEPVLPESVHALRERFDVPIEKLGRLLIVEDAWIAALSPPYPETPA